MYRGMGALVAISSFAIAAAALQSACSRACTEDARNGLVITVRDARTGAGLCNSVVLAFDGSYRENLPNYSNYGVAPPCPHGGANERPGNYRLEISCPGYLPKSVADLLVRKDNPDDCHIANSIALTVDLEPDPNAPRDLDAAAEAD